MFISTKEKNSLLHRIASLELSLEGLAKTLEYIQIKLYKPKPAKKPKTALQKQKQREYMRRYVARKKLEKQNANSVSA